MQNTEFSPVSSSTITSGRRPSAMPRAISILVALHAASIQTARIDPRYAKNLTLYHVNERNYSATPLDMNTADINGDMYFDLRSRGLPLECGPWINESFWSRLDCNNPEVADLSSLAVTKLCAFFTTPDSRARQS